MMAAQLLGSGGVAALLLFGTASATDGAVDVALTLAVLSAFASIAFVKKGTTRELAPVSGEDADDDAERAARRHGWHRPAAGATVSPVLEFVSAALIATGVIFFVAGVVGLLRFPDTLTRLHALTKADNLGLGLIVLGLLPRTADGLAAGKLVIIWLLVMLASATVSQLVGRAARHEEQGR